MALSAFDPAGAPDHKNISARNKRRQSAMAFVDPRIAAIEGAREACGLSHAQLCARARADVATWFALRKGWQRPRLATIARLQDAVRQAPPRVAPMLMLARAIEALVASIFSADPLLRELLVYARPNRDAVTPAMVSRARLRTLAAYVMVGELGIRTVDVAAAFGVGKSRVSDARRHTEELISNNPPARAAFDALVRQLGDTDGGEPWNEATNLVLPNSKQRACTSSCDV